MHAALAKSSSKHFQHKFFGPHPNHLSLAKETAWVPHFFGNNCEKLTHMTYLDSVLTLHRQVKSATMGIYLGSTVPDPLKTATLKGLQIRTGP